MCQRVLFLPIPGSTSRNGALFSTQATSSRPSTAEPEISFDQVPDPSAPTHFKITLLRSAIGLPQRYRQTLEALGIHRRGQTVFHAHNPSTAGKILRVKELVRVQNVHTSEVRTKAEMRRERKAVRGYTIQKSSRDKEGVVGMGNWALH
jgi:large subunit ribosomal protein L30